MNLLQGAFAWVIRSGWQAMVLVLLVVLIQQMLGRRLSARGMCWLWGVVVLRLLMPSLPVERGTMFAGETPQERQILITLERPAAPVSAPGPRVGSAGMVEVAEDVVPTPVRGRAVAIEPSSVPAVAPSRVDWDRAWRALLVALPFIWLAGFIIYGARLIGSCLSVARRVRRCALIEEENLLRDVARWAKDAGLAHAPALRQADYLEGPAVTGLWRPTVLVPSRVLHTFSRNELRVMMLHEFAHLRRRDLWLSALLGALRAVHWFNPAARWAFSRLRDDCELACDEFVLAADSAPAGRTTYGQTLLRLAEAMSGRERSTDVSAIGIVNGRRHLQRRIAMIASFERGQCGVGRAWPMVAASSLLLASGVLLADAADPKAATVSAAPPTASAGRASPTTAPAATTNASVDWKAYLADINAELAAVTVQRQELEAKWNQASDRLRNVNENHTRVAKELLTRHANINNMQHQVDQGNEKWGPNHPTIIEMKKQLQKAKDTLKADEEHPEHQHLETAWAQSQAEMKDLNDRKDEFDHRIERLSLKSKVLTDLTRRFSTLSASRDLIGEEMSAAKQELDRLKTDPAEKYPSVTVAAGRLEGLRRQHADLDKSLTTLQNELEVASGVGSVAAARGKGGPRAELETILREWSGLRSAYRGERGVAERIADLDDRVEKLIVANPTALFDLQRDRLQYHAAQLKLKARQAAFDEAKSRLSRSTEAEKAHSVSAEEVQVARTQASKAEAEMAEQELQQIDADVDWKAKVDSWLSRQRDKNLSAIPTTRPTGG